MREAAEAGVDVLGLTDHDGTSGWDEAASMVAETGVSLLRGMEMSCSWHGITVHLLSYLHDPDDPALLEANRKVIESRQTRAQRMVERIAVDYPITWEDVVAATPPDAKTIGRPHIADALIRAGVFETRDQAFEYVLHPRGPYYCFLWSEDPIEAVLKVRAAGGVPVIAHPRAMKRQRMLPIQVIFDMVDAGLAGIEADHRDNPPRFQKFLREVAAERGLLVTGSSDYHGTGKPNRLAEHTTAPEVIQEIERQSKLDIIRA